MKKVTIARFVMGFAAISAAFGLAACGAETGAPEAEGVGTTSEALSTVQGSALDIPSAMGNDARRSYASACVINDGTADFVVMAGGFSATPSALADSWKYSTAGGWVKMTGAGSTLGTARGNAKILKVDSTHCVMVGGSTSYDGAAVAAVDVLTADTTAHTLKWSSATALTDSRAKFGLETCGSKLIAVGGESSNSAIKTIEVSNDLTASGAWTRYNTDFTDAAHPQRQLKVDAYDFGFAKDGTDGYVVAGGRSASGIETSLQLIKVASCVPTVTAFSTGANDLNTAVEGNVLIPTGTSHQFKSALGRSSTSAAPVTVDTFTVSWTTPSLSSAPALTTPSSPALAASYLPAPFVTSAGKFLALGGEQFVSSNWDTFATNAVQEFASGAFVTPANLFDNGRVGVSPVEFGGKVYTLAGGSVSGGTLTLRTAADEITP